MKRIAMLAGLVVLAAAAGCQPAMDLPANFVPVPGSQRDPTGLYQMRAVSADGVVVGLRHSYVNPENGSLAFWSEAITNQLISSEGYGLVKAEDVKARSGQPGKLLTFAAERSGAAMTYLLAVFVRGEKVVVAEAGGKADAVKPRLEDIKKALLSVR